MIPKAFRPVINAVAILSLSYVAYGSSQEPPKCHSDYRAESFEEADYDLADFLDEYFTDANIPFLPQKNDVSRLGLSALGKGTYVLSGAYIKGGGDRRYPSKAGIWRIDDLDNGIVRTHMLLKEPQKLTEAQAFNTYNDILGEPFADYDDGAYGMTMLPEDVRRSYKGKYFTINVLLYGLQGDATKLSKTVADIILTDYTQWVQENKKCKQK